MWRRRGTRGQGKMRLCWRASWASLSATPHVCKYLRQVKSLRKHFPLLQPLRFKPAFSVLVLWSTFSYLACVVRLVSVSCRLCCRLTQPGHRRPETHHQRGEEDRDLLVLVQRRSAPGDGRVWSQAMCPGLVSVNTVSGLNTAGSQVWSELCQLHWRWWSCGGSWSRARHDHQCVGLEEQQEDRVQQDIISCQVHQHRSQWNMLRCCWK